MGIAYRRAGVLGGIIMLALIVACASSSSPVTSAPDLVSQIKFLSARTAGGISVDGGTTTYAVYFYNPPRGYQNLLRLTEGADQVGVSVWIYESLQDAQRLTLLVDQPLDGRLDYAASASALTISAAENLIQSRSRPSRFELASGQRDYDALLRRIRNDSMYVTTAVKPESRQP